MATKDTDGVKGNPEAIDEMTAAGNTLKPHGGSTAADVGKTQLLAQVVSMMGGMGQGEVNKFSQMINQYGKGKFPGATEVSSTSKGGMAKAAIKEDVANLFAGQEDLSEEFLTKAGTLFEAAVSARVGIELEALQEENEERINEEIETRMEAIEENVEKYISFIANQWIEENRIAVEESIKGDAALNFLESVRELMAENYIEVPEDRIDVVEALEARISELETDLNESINEKIEMEQALEEATMEAVFEDVAEGLIETNVEKFRMMAEDVDFEDVDSYRQKLAIIKENHFADGAKPASAKKGTGLVTEESAARTEEELNEEENLTEGAPAGNGDQSVAGLADYISRQAHNSKYTG